MSHEEQRLDAEPIEKAILDGRGGLDRLHDIWSEVRRRSEAFARDGNSQKAKAHLEGLLRIIALDLQRDVYEILPAQGYMGLWSQPCVPGVLINPIDLVVQCYSRKGLHRDTIGDLEIHYDHLTRLMQVADAVLGRLEASRQAQHAHPRSQDERTPEAPDGKRGPPVWRKDGRSLSPSALAFLNALPAPTLEKAAKAAKINPGSVRKLSRPLQDQGLLVITKGQWRRTGKADKVIAEHV